jgi:hypothetical protein
MFFLMLLALYVPLWILGLVRRPWRDIDTQKPSTGSDMNLAKEISMQGQQGNVEERTIQWIGSAGLMAGAVLIVIGNILLPRAAGAGAVQEMVSAMGAQQRLTHLSALFINAGVWAVMIGAAAVCRIIRARGAAWARLGFSFIVVGTALWTVSMALDVASARAAALWLAAPAAAKDAAYSIVDVLSALGLGVFSMNISVYWLAFAFLGIGMASSAVFSRWLGRVWSILGFAVVPIGIIQIVAGRTAVLNLLFAVCSFLTALWTFATGVWMARKASERAG